MLYVDKRDRWLLKKEEEQILGNCPEWLREIVVFALNIDNALENAEIVDFKFQ